MDTHFQAGLDPYWKSGSGSYYCTVLPDHKIYIQKIGTFSGWKGRRTRGAPDPCCLRIQARATLDPYPEKTVVVAGYTPAQTQIIKLQNTISFFTAFTARDYDLRCTSGDGRTPPKKWIVYHTYNLHIHIYIKTYIHIYNCMYRDKRGIKWLAFIKIDFLCFLLLKIFTS